MTSGTMRRATHAKHYCDPPDVIEGDGARSWITRARNFVVIVSQVRPGSVLVRSDQADESMLLLAPGAAARIEANGEAFDSPGDSLSILPPGESHLTATSARVIVAIVNSAP